MTGDAAKARATEVMSTVATVTTETLYVREQPNTECTILSLMPMGEELEVLEDLGDWVKVDMDGDEGYVSKEYVSISSELQKAMTMTEVKYGQGVSDVRVSLVSYATQFVGNPLSGAGQALQTERTARALFCLSMRNTESHFRTMRLHRRDAERRSVLRRHSREIFSSTAMAEASIMSVSISETVRSYMPAHRRPESRSLMQVTGIRCVLCAF